LGLISTYFESIYADVSIFGTFGVAPFSFTFSELNTPVPIFDDVSFTSNPLKLAENAPDGF